MLAALAAATLLWANPMGEWRPPTPEANQAMYVEMTGLRDPSWFQVNGAHFPLAVLGLSVPERFDATASRGFAPGLVDPFAFAVPGCIGCEIESGGFVFAELSNPFSNGAPIRARFVIPADLRNPFDLPAT
jgi:uncharacterized protein YbjT (DUF2867 family)